MAKKKVIRHTAAPLRNDDADAFIRESEQGSGTKDELAQRLAQDYLRAAASGQNDDEDSPQALLAEELGGAFLESRSEVEFGATLLRSTGDPADEASPLPLAVGSLTLASPDEELEAAENRAEAGDDDVEAPDAEAEVASRLEPDIHALDRASHLR